MFAHVMRLTLWEWFKLRGRWMPWIMLAIAVVLAQLGMWFAYAAYHNQTLQELTSGRKQLFRSERGSGRRDHRHKCVVHKPRERGVAPEA